MIAILTLLSLTVGLSHAFNSTVLSPTITYPAGRTCVLSPNGKDPVCTMDANFKDVVRQLTQQFKKTFSKPIQIPKKLKTTSSDICGDLSPFIPTEYCKCADNSGGAEVSCTYNVVIDGAQIDVLYMYIYFEVCEDPAMLEVVMVDGDTGLKFDTGPIKSGMSGSLPTGIILGVPGVGNVQLLLSYKMLGNADSLTVDLGMDFEIVVFFISEKCSTFFPSDCPVWFFEETINFGDNC